jgi:hypothetical protein
MRPAVHAAIVLVLGLVLLAPGGAPGKEGTSYRMVNPRFIDFPPTPPLTGSFGSAFVPGVSTGRVYRANNCRQKVKLDDLFSLQRSDGLPGTGDEIICLAHAWMDMTGPQFGTIVMRGEVRSDNGGRFRTELVAHLDKETTLCKPVGVGDAATDTYYESRGTRCYEPDPSYAPPITVPFNSDPTQGLVLGAYAPAPSSPLISTEGLYFGSPGGAFLDGVVFP